MATASKGSTQSFEGTYWASIHLPEILGTISSWIKENLTDDDLASSTLFKNRVQTDPHISVLLGLPRPPDEGLKKLLSTIPPPELSFGSLKAFPLETRVVVNNDKSEEVHKYRVLHVEVLENKSLLLLQEAIGEYYADTDSATGVATPVRWHYPKYNPHITVAFVKEGVAERFLDTNIFPADKSSLTTTPKTVTFKKFRDEKFMPVQIGLATL